MNPRLAPAALAVAALWQACLMTSQAFAAAPLELPPEDVVREALSASPRLRIALESMARGEAMQQRFVAGPHEWAVQATTQHRRDAQGVTRDEQEYGLQRGLRWPGKSALDRQIGSLEREVGKLAYLDAWHEAARDLLEMWFAWIHSEEQFQLKQRQLQVMEEQLAAIARRVAAGDAALLDQQLAEAELSRMRAATNTARRAAHLAQAALEQEFPALPLNRPSLPASPEALSGTDAEWIDHIADDNHEVELARARRDTAQATADRTALDRIADPIIGLRFSNNMDGDRNVIGLTITMPIGGAGRTADTALARSNARRSEAEVMRTEGQVAAAARVAVREARDSHVNWREQQAALQLQQAAADKVARGYEHGEFDISILLAARRAALDAEEALLDARMDASQAHAKVLVDAHRIWTAPED